MNDLFSCTVTNDCLHIIHVVPLSVKDDIVRMGGPRRYFGFVKGKLLDAFEKIADVLEMDDNSNVREVYAVSKLLLVMNIFKNVLGLMNYMKQLFLEKIF